MDMANPGSRTATRRFLVVCHRALPACACQFRLADLKEKRLDLVARCISSSLFLSEGTRRDTEVLFCFPKTDHEHLGSMRQRLQHKKHQHPEGNTSNSDDQHVSSSHHCTHPEPMGICAKDSSTETTANTDDKAQSGWLVLRVSGDGVRHLKPDERSVGSIVRHFLYAGECSGNGDKISGGAHALLLGATGYEPIGPDGVGSALSKGWTSFPSKKCCKGFSVKRVTTLPEVIPCSGWIETVDHPKRENSRHLGVFEGQEAEPRSRALVHLTHRLVPSDDSISPISVLQALCPEDGLHQHTLVSRSFVMGDDVGFMRSDEEELKHLAGIPTSLGPGMLLSSHCVVLLNHYLDFIDARD